MWEEFYIYYIIKLNRYLKIKIQLYKFLTALAIQLVFIGKYLKFSIF